MRPNGHAAAVDAVVTTICRLTRAIVILFIVLVSNHLYARDDDRFANSPLNEWFDHLGSRNGLCCAFADGVSVQDVDRDTREGHYRVLIQGEWFVVPDAALVTKPNRFGPAVVWLTMIATATHEFVVSCPVPARNSQRPCWAHPIARLYESATVRRLFRLSF